MENFTATDGIVGGGLTVTALMRVGGWLNASTRTCLGNQYIDEGWWVVQCIDRIGYLPRQDVDYANRTCLTATFPSLGTYMYLCDMLVLSWLGCCFCGCGGIILVLFNNRTTNSIIYTLGSMITTQSNLG